MHLFKTPVTYIVLSGLCSIAALHLPPAQPSHLEIPASSSQWQRADPKYRDQRPQLRRHFIRQSVPQPREQAGIYNSPRHTYDHYQQQLRIPVPSRFQDTRLEAAPSYIDPYHHGNLRNGEGGGGGGRGGAKNTYNQPFLDADAQADIAEAAADRRRQARSRGGEGPGGGGGPIATSTYNRPVLDADAQADIAEAAANRKRRERGGGGGAGGGGGEGRGGAGGPKADSAYKKPRLNADALAEQPEVVADRKSANQKSKRPDSATPKKQKSNPGFSSTQTATNQQTTSVDQIQMDPAVMNSVKNLRRAHGAETFSVSRTVRKEEPTSIAKPSPMAMDALYNDFVTFMSERLKREPNTVHKSVLPEQLPETDPVGISSVKPKSVNHKPTIQLHPKHKLASSAIDNTKSSYQENVPSSNIQSTHKKQSEPKKQLDKSIRTKRKKVNALTTSSEMGNNNAFQIQTIANAEAVITEKKKSSKGSNTKIRTSSQTSSTPQSGTESKSLPDLSALQNIASFFTNNVVPKLDRSNQQPNFVFVMINSQSVPNPISQIPILSAVSKSSTPNLQNTAVKDHTNKFVSAIAENNKAGIKTETPTADKSIYDKHILETHAHNEANLASAGRHIGSHRKASTGAADMQIHTGPQTNRFGPGEVHVGHASGTARGTPAFGEVHVGHARGTIRGASNFGEVHVGHSTRGTARGPPAFGEVHVGHARGASDFGEVHLGHARGTARGAPAFVPEPAAPQDLEAMQGQAERQLAKLLKAAENIPDFSGLFN